MLSKTTGDGPTGAPRGSRTDNSKCWQGLGLKPFTPLENRSQASYEGQRASLSPISSVPGDTPERPPDPRGADGAGAAAPEDRHADVGGNRVQLRTSVLSEKGRPREHTPWVLVLRARSSGAGGSPAEGEEQATDGASSGELALVSSEEQGARRGVPGRTAGASRGHVRLCTVNGGLSLCG